jgi:hypothetical protein
MLKQKIFLNISEIAAYIGQNKYDFVTPFERIWKRSDSENYNRILNLSKNEINNSNLELDVVLQKKKLLENDLIDKKITKRQYTTQFNKLNVIETETKEKVLTLEKQIDNISLTQSDKIEKVLGKEILNKIGDNQIETETKRIATQTLIKNMDLSNDKKELMLKETESLINKTHGTLKEDSAIELFEKQFNIKLDTSQIYNKRIFNVNFDSKYDWYIGGKVDGLYKTDKPEECFVVEVKNRTKGFFSNLRDYEKTQIQLYIWILNLSQARLVEKFNERIRNTMIYRDDSYINENILDLLQIFIKNFETKFLNNDNEKEKIDYIKKNNEEKNIFLKQLYLIEIEKSLEEKLEEKNQHCLIDDLDTDEEF